MNQGRIREMIEQATPQELQQFYAGAQKVIKLMPESLRLRRKASLIPEEKENEKETRFIRTFTGKSS